MTKNKPSPSTLLQQNNPWKGNSNKVWLGSILRVSRNLEKFNFPGKLSTDRQKGIVKLITESISKNTILQDPVIFHADDINPIDKEFIAERFLAAEGFYQAHAGEGFVLDKTGTFLGTINIDDHLHLELMDTSGEIEKHWNELVAVETEFGKYMNYAFSQRFGFLTADPTLCGTGMQIHLFLQLPGLIHTGKIDDVLTNTVEDSVAVTGLQGNPTEVIGDILTLKNNYTLGVNEENVLSSLEALTTKLTVEENATRKHIIEDKNTEIMDRVSRAYGILIHSYQIEAIEALNALSLVKFGVDASWITGITIAEVNELFFNCRRAHMICQIGEEIEQEELAHKRAEFIHTSLKNVKLTI